MNLEDLKGLTPYCDDKEVLLLEALKKTLGDSDKASDILGVNRATVYRQLNKLKLKATREGHVTDGTLKKISFSRDKNGDVVRSWEGYTFDTTADTVKAFSEATDIVAEKLANKSKVKAFKSFGNKELLTNYVFTDLHLGQYSYGKETEEDVDADIVVANTIAGMQLLVEGAPKAAKAIVLDMGDTLHASNDDARTKSGHVLDTDSRHSRVYGMLLEMKIAMIELALAKHDEVLYIALGGNHSDLVAIYVRAHLKAYFRNEPRFSVMDNPALHQYYQHGETLLGFHHGHSTPMKRLPEVMVWDCREILSSTKYRYWLTGHVHSANVVDNSIAKLESFRNLTQNDAWAQGAGYRSLKEVVAITYSDRFGEVTRNIVSLDMIKDRLGDD